MKSVLPSDNPSRFFADQTRSLGMLQRYRPNQSPTPKTRKWSELKKSGWIEGFVGRIEIVMVGKMDWVACHVMSRLRMMVFDNSQG